MTVIEWSQVVVAASAAAVAISIVVLVLRTLPLLRQLDAATIDLRASLERLRHVSADLEAVSRDARYTESRVSNTVNRLLDQAEPPLKVLTAALAGARAGLGALVGGSRDQSGATRPEASSRDFQEHGHSNRKGAG